MAQQKLFGEKIATDLSKLQATFQTHEAVCKKRWDSVTNRHKRIELVLMSSAGAIILLLSGIIWKG